MAISYTHVTAVLLYNGDTPHCGRIVGVGYDKSRAYLLAGLNYAKNTPKRDNKTALIGFGGV
jgi:hypothetical protein